MPCPKDIPPNPGELDEEKNVADVHAESDYHRQDEQVNVCLECISTNLKTLKRRFIRCSAQATILHLKKFVAKKVLNGMEKYRDVSNKFSLSFKSSKSFVTFKIISSTYSNEVPCNQILNTTFILFLFYTQYF